MLETEMSPRVMVMPEDVLLSTPTCTTRAVVGTLTQLDAVETGSECYPIDFQTKFIKFIMGVTAFAGVPALKGFRSTLNSKLTYAVQESEDFLGGSLCNLNNGDAVI
jgi:hypothetical protein